MQQENESLRDQVLEVQSNFTAQDRNYLQLVEQKQDAETEYEHYRISALNEIKQLAEQVKGKEKELAKLKKDLADKHNPALSRASGFSLDTDTDKVTVKLREITATIEEESKRNEEITVSQDKEIEKNQSLLEEARAAEQKQMARMAELQEELQQTIKRIEQL